ncbi:unnamed protein product [Mucor hiemalis]
MQLSPLTTSYEHETTQPPRHLPSFKHLFESLIVDNDSSMINKSSSYEQLSPPQLYDETEDDSDSSPSRSLSPKQSFHDLDIFLHHRPINDNNSNRSLSDSYIKSLPSSINRRKSVPYKSPSSSTDNSVVFQVLNHPTGAEYYQDYRNACDQPSTKIICGQSLLSKLRKRVEHARNLIHLPPSRSAPRLKNRTTPQWRSHSIIEIPHPIAQHHVRPWVDEEEEQIKQIEKFTCQPLQNQQNRKRPSPPPQQHDESDVKRIKKSVNETATYHRAPASVAGRPSRVKGPCQACNEASDGCMRKAFNWPFPANRVFNDKGKPFVYLCNKCGLRYNKSGGCVCRHCRWVFCKEEKRKALQHINVMRMKRPDGYIDPEEEIENFLCSPKYWTCGRKWKVGWVLNNLGDEEEAETSV